MRVSCTNIDDGDGDGDAIWDTPLAAQTASERVRPWSGLREGTEETRQRTEI